MNLGTKDRIIRLITGLAFVTIDFFSNAQGEIVFLFIGVWGVLTSAFGYCPFFGVAGVNTCPSKIENITGVSED